MPIKYNKVTWYSKLGAVILFVLVVPCLTFYIGRVYQQTIDVLENVGPIIPATGADAPVTFDSPLNGAYEFDGQKIILVNGKAEQVITPGSVSELVTSIFGQPVTGDLDNDGTQDSIFFVSQETGGTGVFFYVVAAVKVGGQYAGTKAIFLGDRIAPQNITIKNGVASVNYALRKAGEPMSAQASVGTTKYVAIREGDLVEVK